MDRRAAGNQSEIQSLRQRIANIEAREKNGRSPGK
jgi:hypothetical protein